jgi:predicted DNA-binding ribbon-helix-helix protein
MVFHYGCIPQGAAVAGSRLINRNVVAGRGRTSMRLEPELWDALAEICRREGQDMNRLVRQIEAIGHEGGRTSAVRVFALQYFRAAACEAGHRAAEHGRLDGGVPDSAPPQECRLDAA